MGEGEADQASFGPETSWTLRQSANHTESQAAAFVRRRTCESELFKGKWLSLSLLASVTSHPQS